MAETPSWRDILLAVCNTPQKKQEVAQTVGFVSVRTIDRWISGSSNPQKQETIRKLGLVNEALNEALKREFPEAFQVSKSLGGQIGRIALPAEFYQRVIHAYAHVPLASRRWTIWHLVSNQMLPHLDPERTGFLVIYTRLSADPARLLCEEGAGNTLWTTKQVQTPAEVQNAYDADPWLVQAIAAGRPFFLQSCISSPSYLLHHELIHSLGFFPIYRSGRTGGGLLLCARQEDFFTPLRQTLIEEYTCLFALALSDSDFAQTPP